MLFRSDLVLVHLGDQHRVLDLEEPLEHEHGRLDVDQEVLLAERVGAAVALLDALLDERLQQVGLLDRSEERRVGKECRSRWSPYH